MRCQVYLGIVVPVLFAGYGMYCLISGSGFFFGSGFGHWVTAHKVHGKTAIALGFSCLGLAMFLNCHCYWSERPFFWRIAALGSWFGAIVWLTSIAYVIWQVARDVLR